MIRHVNGVGRVADIKAFTVRTVNFFTMKFRVCGVFMIFVVYIVCCLMQPQGSDVSCKHDFALATFLVAICNMRMRF
jgi:phage shock protein PspC (stress-responsive transcriptional regulator)